MVPEPLQLSRTPVPYAESVLQAEQGVALGTKPPAEPLDNIVGGSRANFSKIFDAEPIGAKRVDNCFIYALVCDELHAVPDVRRSA